MKLASGSVCESESRFGVTHSGSTLELSRHYSPHSRAAFNLFRGSVGATIAGSADVTASLSIPAPRGPCAQRSTLRVVFAPLLRNYDRVGRGPFPGYCLRHGAERGPPVSVQFAPTMCRRTLLVGWKYFPAPPARLRFWTRPVGLSDDVGKAEKFKEHRHRNRSAVSVKRKS